jgi:hypothetical protein
MRGIGKLMVREVGRVSGDWSGDYLRKEREDWEESSEVFTASEDHSAGTTMILRPLELMTHHDRATKVDDERNLTMSR